MALMIYNSLTDKIEEFIPGDKNNIKMYVCGPTVYNYIHIGNARPVVFYDMLRNYLEYLGYKVTYASNITDIDDRIIREAAKQGITEREHARRIEKSFFEDCDKLGSRRPDLVPRATEFIPDMVEFIQKLVDKGFAYQSGTDVYFRVNEISDYGILSNQVQEQLNTGVRIEVDSNKENPFDFNLWKDTEMGIKFDSPFGAGRPGWHTECVVMNHKLFGDEIDIHGGGMDLKFPHHENEIAQSGALYGNHLSRYWMHVGRLDLDGEKMSKSLGNVITVRDLTPHQAIIIRMVLIFSPYRNNISYNETLYTQYEKEYEKWLRTVLGAQLQLNAYSKQTEEVNLEDMKLFETYMNQDLNVQNVLTLLQNIMKNLNIATRNNDYETMNVKLNTFLKIISIMGIRLDLPSIDEEVLQLYKEWQEARKMKDFESADRFRELLISKKVLL